MTAVYVILALSFFASWFVIAKLERKGAKTDKENRLLSWLYRAFLIFILILIVYGLLTIPS